jgi:hypothetical protein
VCLLFTDKLNSVTAQSAVGGFEMKNALEMESQTVQEVSVDGGFFWWVG